jgi:sorting nexin-4
MSHVTGNRFSSEFAKRRAYSLQRFLQRCALHPILRRSSILHIFLESSDWNATMRSQSTRASTASAAESSGGGVFDSFTDSFMNVFSKVNKPDRRFTEVREKADKLDEDLGHVEKVVARVARRETDIETDYKDLAEQFQKLIVLEPTVESSIHGFAASVEDTAASLKKLREATDQDYLGSLRDMQAYSGSLKNLLKTREQKQVDFESLTDYLNKATLERDSLASGYHGSVGGGAFSGAAGYLRSKVEDARGVDHEQSRRERQRKLEIRIDELTAEVERAKTTAEMFDEEVVREVGDFERIKKAEFKKQLGGFADAHIEFFDNVRKVWEQYILDMEKEGVPEA